MADFTELGKKALQMIAELVNKEPLSVISITRDGDKWVVLTEVLERKSVPDTQNIIGIYQLTFSKGKDLLGYRRTELRRKGDMGEETIAEVE
ncbi:unnamed protein product [marine sediment metagenome]|uniref:Gas vesicle synthesis protein GvpO n=1 Tax=marine sediment metagenome TaxID=412755 RepID=X1VJM9_9ZZZZ